MRRNRKNRCFPGKLNHKQKINLRLEFIYILQYHEVDEIVVYVQVEKTQLHISAGTLLTRALFILSVCVSTP